MKKWFEGLPLLWWLKLFFIVLALFFGVLFVLPSFLGNSSLWPQSSETGDYLKWHHRVASKILPDTHLALGLDLRGGGQLTLAVDLEETLNDRLKRSIERVRLSLSKENIDLDGIHYESESIRITFEKDNDWKRIAEVMRDQVDSLNPTPDVLQDEKALIFYYNNKYIQSLTKKILAQSVEAIRERTNAYGLVEPSVFQSGRDRIVVQIPGVYNPDETKEVLGSSAQLDFRLVYGDFEPEQLNSWIAEARKDLKIEEEGDSLLENSRLLNRISEHLRNQEKIPAGRTILPLKVTRDGEDENEKDYFYPYLVELFPRLTGDLIDEAIAEQGRASLSFLPEPMVFLKFNSQGAKLFGDLTTDALKSEIVNHQVAIVLDDIIISAPRVSTPILTGDAQISLGSSGHLEKKLTEARDLAMMLRSGALPAKVKVVEERQIGPSEGRANIRSGLLSSLAAAIGLITFILLIYGNAGLVANLGMLFNVLLILAVLAAFGATLTLPGIAGIVLTMAIAVDGNVIINERIREEVRRGSSHRNAFYKGYRNSFVTLLDAHLTSAVGGVVLLSYGNPAIKGFAVTLLIGIFSTLFTSYYFTEVVGLWLVEKTRFKRFH
jgi:preprotein translocase subunit SecD